MSVSVSGVTATEPEAVGGIVFITQAASERQRENEGWELKENEGGPKEKGVSASFGGQNYMNTLSFLRNLQRNQFILYQPVMHLPTKI